MNYVRRLKIKAREIKDKAVILYYAYAHPDTGLIPRVLIGITLAYAMSPIDLIPDFIPILGYLDDVIIIPLLISISIRLIPAHVMAYAEERQRQEPVTLQKDLKGALMILLFWLLIIIVVVRKIWF